jgi:hypothetical protein
MNLFTLFGKSRTASVGSMPPTKPLADILPLPIKYNGNAPKEWADKIEYAFTSGSVHFFRFISEPYIPYTRANAALDIYEELEWGISPAFLQKHIQAVDSVLTDPKNKTKEQLLAKLAVLNSQFKERMNLATNLTLRMKLATVLYFDETEDITTYNYQKGVEKVAHWTNHHDVPDFFLKLPILNFLPYLSGWEASLATLIRAEAISQIQMLEAVTMLDISDETNPELANLLGLQREIYQTLRNWKK